MSNASRGAARLPVPFSGTDPSTGVANIEEEPTVAADGGGLTERMERFCRAYVAGGNGALAAREAGYAASGARRQAHRLLGRPDVRHRVRQLQLAVAEETCTDVRVLMAKLETVYRKALQAHQFHAAARAVEGQSRLAGYLTQGSHRPGDDGGGPNDRRRRDDDE